MTDPDIIIELPGPPMSKARHRSKILKNKYGGQFIHNYPDPETKAYEAQLKFAAQQAMAGREPLTGAAVLFLVFYTEIPASLSQRKQELCRSGRMRPITKPDWDNAGKITDALKGVVWLDDKLAVDAVVRKFYSPRPRLWIKIWPCPEEEHTEESMQTIPAWAGISRTPKAEAVL
jgi:Holliday junction resolvase RusA-like endonuclease